MDSVQEIHKKILHDICKRSLDYLRCNDPFEIYSQDFLDGFATGMSEVENIVNRAFGYDGFGMKIKHDNEEEYNGLHN